MKITDGMNTVEIQMFVWSLERMQYGEDLSDDFFEDAILESPDGDERIFLVDNVDYCVADAMDWKLRRGEFSEDESTEERAVFVQ